MRQLWFFLRFSILLHLLGRHTARYLSSFPVCLPVPPPQHCQLLHHRHGIGTDTTRLWSPIVWLPLPPLRSPFIIGLTLSETAPFTIFKLHLARKVGIRTLTNSFGDCHATVTSPTFGGGLAPCSPGFQPGAWGTRIPSTAKLWSFPPSVGIPRTANALHYSTLFNAIPMVANHPRCHGRL